MGSVESKRVGFSLGSDQPEVSVDTGGGQPFFCMFRPLTHARSSMLGAWQQVLLSVSGRETMANIFPQNFLLFSLGGGNRRCKSSQVSEFLQGSDCKRPIASMSAAVRARKPNGLASKGQELRRRPPRTAKCQVWNWGQSKGRIQAPCCRS